MKLSKPLSRSVAALVLLFALVASADTVMVPMPDGIKLATDYYLPQGEGPFPVVLMRTPYDKNGADEIAGVFTKQGIAWVAQDSRGMFASEGTYRGFGDGGWGERQDGKHTVEWIRAQPWCNGKVGTWGPSALGITQVMLAGTGTELSCQWIQVASSNFYDHLSYHGGVLRKNLVEEWLKSRGAPHVIEEWKAHSFYDAFWLLFNAEIRANEVNTPAVHIGGWFDIFAPGTINSFVTRQHHGGPKARGNQKLIMGPWPHVPFQEFGDLKFPDNFNFDLDGYRDRFFAYWLNGEDDGIMSEPAVHYYVMGDCDDPAAPGNKWRTADTWPPFPTVQRPYFLAKRRGLVEDLNQARNRSVSFPYDPDNPCPTHGGANLRMGPLDVGPFDQRKVSNRPDVLTFATPPLEKPVEVTGNVRLKLYVSTDAVDTDFTGKLLDIYPDGREILLTDNIQRVKMRNGLDKPDLLPPHAIGELDIDLWPISIVFNEGHRIAVQISSSNYPRFEINPNNGDNFPGETPVQVARNTIHFGSKHPSALYLPIRSEGAIE